MKLVYYPETDSLYIDLSEKTSVESKEISEGVVLDYDAEGKLVGIDIDNASTKVQLKELSLRKITSGYKCSSVRQAGNCSGKPCSRAIQAGCHISGWTTINYGGESK